MRNIFHYPSHFIIISFVEVQNFPHRIFTSENSFRKPLTKIHLYSDLGYDISGHSVNLVSILIEPVVAQLILNP